MVRVIIDGSRCKECEYCLHFCPRGNVLKKGRSRQSQGLPLCCGQPAGRVHWLRSLCHGVSGDGNFHSGCELRGTKE